MDMYPDIEPPVNEDGLDPREREDFRVDDDDRSVDSEQADLKQKLGELTDSDDEHENIVGNLIEITHDGKVTKEVLKVGEGKKLKMGYKAFIKYKAYFLKDHLIFDKSDEVVELCLGDNSWPDGLQTGTEKMRKGEISKIRIKSKHGFGRPLKRDELKFPVGYDSEGPKQQRLLSETIIYEVELVDYEERVDLDANGVWLKNLDVPAEKHEWETPKDQDEIHVDLTFK